MPDRWDLLYVSLLAIAWPLYDYFVDWPGFLRRLQAAAGRARRHAYAKTVSVQWLLVAAGILLWARAGRPWSSLGLRAPGEWRLWASVAALLLLAWLYAWQAMKAARSARTRAALRRALAGVDRLAPHTEAELRGFLVVSLTAGVCEEFLFRGYCARALAPWLGPWGAAAVAVAAFGLLHAYQGSRGIVKTAAVGAVMHLVVAATGSLIPAMALHTLIDCGSGVVAWLALKEADGSDEGDRSVGPSHATPGAAPTT